MNHRPIVRFTVDEANAAAEEWGFNCGPAALCAVTGKTPTELRPDLLDFEEKGYTNPMLMVSILRRLGASFRQLYRADCLPQRDSVTRVALGLMRVQWSGPWTQPGVPMKVRYRHTHWVAVSWDEVFDVNAICIGGWLSRSEWQSQLVPWLIREACPRGDGGWWPTHVLSVDADLNDRVGEPAGHHSSSSGTST